jgi:hypothetical protein
LLPKRDDLLNIDGIVPWQRTLALLLAHLRHTLQLAELLGTFDCLRIAAVVVEPRQPGTRVVRCPLCD